MTLQYLQQHWALLAASILGTAVLLFVLWRAWLDSARGRLAVARRDLRAALATARKRQRQAQSLAATLDRLEARSASVRPIRLQEAAEAIQDAEALLKIAADQVLIAENHVRKIIVEEFPPKRHERMRNRYLSGERADGRPFSF
jgi:uncharacterized protein YlxW (UPF0749 family)